MSKHTPTSTIIIALGSLAGAAAMCLMFAIWLNSHGFGRRFEPLPPRGETTPLKPHPEPQQVTFPNVLPLETLSATQPQQTGMTPLITEYEEKAHEPLIPPSPTTPPTKAEKAPEPPAAPNWLTNAAPMLEVPTGNARMVLVIDDMGLDPAGTQQAENNLPPAVTLAYMPYVEGNRLAVVRAKEAGHEILIHLPMQPRPHPTNPTLNPGPNTLETTDSPETLEKKIAENLAPFADLAVGVNNHMGSAFTGNEKGMEILLSALQKNGLLFLDSVTIAPTATSPAAKAVKASLPIFKRQVFLDDTPTPEAITTQFNRAVALAKKNGKVIVIGHPHPETLAVLEAKLPTLAEQGITIVPLTSFLK